MRDGHSKDGDLSGCSMAPLYESDGGMRGADFSFLRCVGCSSIEGMLIAILLRSRTLGTVEGGGVGKRGCAMRRRGGESDRELGGGGVFATGSSAIEAVSS
jgi:hypothetical protein